ncbi:MAG: glycosyltransferase [Planctomycetota bacterium]|nr:MAG: glycosyltransferase [Planctomycetota bacterium]
MPFTIHALLPACWPSRARRPHEPAMSTAVRVILAHCRYRSGIPSGENSAVDRQAAWMEAAGIPLIRWERRSDDLLAAGRWAQARAAWALPGNAARRRALVHELRPLADGRTVLHLHNPWPLYTYDLAQAAQSVGIPVVQTLHNYRLIASNQRWVSDGRLRRPTTAAEQAHVSALGAMHHGRLAEWAYRRALSRLWRQNQPATALTTLICLSHFQQQQVIAAGIPASRTTVIPNAMPDPGPPPNQRPAGEYALFVGRLDSMKGIDWLMQAWPACGLPLTVVGDGPLAACCQGIPGVNWLGSQPTEHVQRLMAGARLLVMASRWYEGHPLVLVEALARGLPCLVPDLGGLPEVIHGEIGRVYRPGDKADLASQAQTLWHNPPPAATCYAAFTAHYEQAAHRARLEECWRHALAVGTP